MNNRVSLDHSSGKSLDNFYFLQPWSDGGDDLRRSLRWYKRGVKGLNVSKIWVGQQQNEV